MMRGHEMEINYIVQTHSKGFSFASSVYSVNEFRDIAQLKSNNNNVAQVSFLFRKHSAF